MALFFRLTADTVHTAVSKTVCLYDFYAVVCQKKAHCRIFCKTIVNMRTLKNIMLQINKWRLYENNFIGDVNYIFTGDDGTACGLYDYGVHKRGLQP